MVTRKTVKKTSRKKNTKKTSQRKESFTERHRGTINFLLALVLLCAVVLLFSFVKIYVESQPGEVIAIVNGHEIYDTDVEEVYRRLPPSMQEISTDELVLEQLIQELLILQRASQLEIKASDEEIDAAITDTLGQYGLTEEKMDVLLEQQGISNKEFRAMIRNNVIMKKLFEKEAYGFEITDAEALDYYNANALRYVIPLTVEVRHIMINIEEDEVDAKARAQALLKETKSANFENFCDLVLEHSADQPSKENCGKYNITENMPIPEEFISASFAMEDGEGRVVKTEKNYHVIHRIKLIPETIIRFDVAKSSIKKILKQAKTHEAQRTYLAELRENADVQNFLMEDLVEEIEEYVEEKQEIEEQSLEFCLAEKVILYGASWDSQTKEQFAELGDVEVPYVECSVSGDVSSQAGACKSVKAYPTWIIKGMTHLGVQSLERVMALAEC